MPAMQTDTYGSFAELSANHPEQYFHYFADTRVVLANKAFFAANRHKTIVLTQLTAENPGVGNFHTICVAQPEKQLVRSILTLEQHAHAKGRNLPPSPTPHDSHTSILTKRETEVMTLVAKGLLNKQIADALNISLPTVITHRKNVMDKLGMKSVSALTIYAVMHGYVDVAEI
jgi:DNA-binding CsgD family transcriptional regulator